MTKKTTSRTAVAMALFALIAAAPSFAQQTGPENTVSGITKPSIHSKLGLNQLGIIRDLPVKEGQAVKKGEVLLQQDDRAEVAALQGLEAEANSEVKIEASKADLKVKQVQLKRTEEMIKSGSASPSELEEAQLKVVYAEAQIKIAELDKQTAGYKAVGQRIRVDQMKLTSPVDGFVEAIDVSVGEVTDPQKPVMTVVQNDPMWIEFYLPTAQSLKLKKGQQLDVKYDGEQKWEPAKLIYRAPVADAASGMQKLRLEMTNPQNKDTGLQVQIKLPAELGAAPANPGAAAAAAK